MYADKVGHGGSLVRQRPDSKPICSCSEVYNREQQESTLGYAGLGAEASNRGLT